MTRSKSYRLLCPIARALDRVGDRWSLLILRDLHAGPARFGDLQSALPGLASNLLATRLEALQRDGLVVGGRDGYALTEDGEATAPLLFELASFGSRFGPPDDVRRPGNLRTVAVTLKEALRRAVDASTDEDVELVVDGEHFAVMVSEGRVSVLYEPAPAARLAIETNYEALIAVGDGDMTPAELGRAHVSVIRGSQKAARSFLGILGKAFKNGDAKRTIAAAGQPDQ